VRWTISPVSTFRAAWVTAASAWRSSPTAVVCFDWLAAFASAISQAMRALSNSESAASASAVLAAGSPASLYGSGGSIRHYLLGSRVTVKPINSIDNTLPSFTRQESQVQSLYRPPRGGGTRTDP
jgi:hypothetical protein